MSLADRPELGACYHTLSGGEVLRPARHGFEERLAALSAAGFTDTGMLVKDFNALLAQGHDSADLRGLAETYGIAVSEIEVLWGWQHVPVRASAYEEQMYAVCQVFSAERIIAVIEEPRATAPALEQVAEAFAALCDRAAGHGLTVLLEPVPTTALSDLAAASELIHGAGRQNSGIALDTYHFLRGGGRAEDLAAIPAELIKSIQLADADENTSRTYLEDSFDHRRLPGCGSLDLVGLLVALGRRGVDALISVEAPSAELRALPVEESAHAAAAATRAVLAEVRGRLAA